MRPLLITTGAVAVLIVAAGAGFWALTAPGTIAAEALPAHEPDIAHGEQVFHAAGCGGCHAAPEAEGADRLRLGGGAPLITPFGTFHPPNISPDPEAGIGGWSDLEFVNAVMRGVSPEGAHYYPAFPYTSYQHMTIEDALDLKAFIDTLPPVAEPAPAHELPLLLRFRRGIGLWKWLFMDRPWPAPARNADPQIRRGAYLVTALGHCGQCHTPRNWLGGMNLDHFLAGGPAPDDPKKTVPNITPGPDGIGDWSEKDIVDALRTGLLPGFETLGGAMSEVQQNLARLPDEYLQAIAAYLKSIPPLPDTPEG